MSRQNEAFIKDRSGAPMKLSESQINSALSQLEVQVLEEDDPIVVHFSELFGQHTFFLDGKGLNVLELLEVPGTATQDGEVIRVARWNDENFTSLSKHRPEPTGVVISLKEVRH
jgi:hypothetical protein